MTQYDDSGQAGANQGGEDVRASVFLPYVEAGGSGDDIHAEGFDGVVNARTMAELLAKLALRHSRCLEAPLARRECLRPSGPESPVSNRSVNAWL